jgi:hypothetical protein
MSDQVTGSGTPPQTPEALAAEIERTRHELGETVEALVGKTDVKARAQHRAAEVIGNLRGQARTAAGKARDGVRDAKHKARRASEKAARHAPAIPSAGSSRVYGAAAAALTAAALTVAWLMVRRRGRHR